MGVEDEEPWKSWMRTPVDRSSKRNVKKIRSEAQKGIDVDVRPLVYVWLLKPKKLVGTYEALANKGLEDEELAHTIEADAIRTIPSPVLEEPYQHVCSKSLERILTAYANHVPEGMSSLASIILKHSTSEEQAFELFNEFMRLFNFPEVFKPGFPLLFRWIRMFEELMDIELPTVRKKLLEKGITSELYVDKWFLTATAYNFPDVTCLRLWDIMLVDGNEKILFRAGIALLRLGEEKGVFERGFEETIRWLQSEFSKERELIDNGGDEFVKRACSVVYSRKTLQDAADGKSSRPKPFPGCFN